jgi:hypothetical protein
MAFIHDDVAVVLDQRIDLALPRERLHHGDVDFAGGVGSGSGSGSGGRRHSMPLDSSSLSDLNRGTQPESRPCWGLHKN